MGKKKNGRLKYFEIFIITVFIFMFLGSCNKKRSDDKNVIIKDNPKAYTKWEEVFSDHKIIKFKGLSEEDELVDVRGLAINSRGEYFIQDSQKRSIYYFNNKGVFQRKIVRDGEGPGEAIMPSVPRFDSKDNIYIYDFLKKKIIIFNFPDYKYKREFKVMNTFVDFFISNDNKIIATTPYTPDNYTIHKYDMNGKMIDSAFMPDDIPFKNFITVFSLFRISELPEKNGFLYIFPNKYKIYQYDYNLKLVKTYTVEKETEYFPFKGHFPYGETPYELTKKNQKWWESKYIIWFAKEINKKYFFLYLIKTKKYNIEDSFINIHTFNGKTIAKGVRIPFKGYIRYVKNGYIYVVEADRVDERTGDVVPQVIHRYRFRL